MVSEKISFVKAAQEFFSAGPFGRKVMIPEFKMLTTQDKVELSEELNKIPGYEHEPYTGEKMPFLEV
jgi:hypothetical protein